MGIPVANNFLLYTLCYKFGSKNSVKCFWFSFLVDFYHQQAIHEQLQWVHAEPLHGGDGEIQVTVQIHLQGQEINIYLLIKFTFMLSALLNKVLLKYSSNSIEWNYFSTLWKLCLLLKLHFITFTPNAFLINQLTNHLTPTNMHLHIRWILLITRYFWVRRLDMTVLVVTDN